MGCIGCTGRGRHTKTNGPHNEPGRTSVLVASSRFLGGFVQCGAVGLLDQAGFDLDALGRRELRAAAARHRARRPVGVLPAKLGRPRDVSVGHRVLERHAGIDASE